MRFFITSAVLAASLAFNPLVRADDNDLFSEVAMEFVYATGDQSKSDQKDTNTESLLPTRVTGSSTLVTLLESAGFEPKRLDSRSVSLDIRAGSWNLKTSIKSDVVAERLTINMPLAKVAEGASIDQGKLLRLLAVGNGEGDVFFSYDKADGMITLRRVMPNRGLSGQKIKQELADMAEIAQDHEDAWSELEKTTKQPAKTFTKTTKTPAPTTKPAATKPAATKPTATKPTATKPTATKPAAPRLTLVGTWSAALAAGEAFAIQINRDATFQLVHVKSGKSVTSNGKAARSGNQLTLNGSDGTKIVGQISQRTADAFKLTISSTTLDFKKAK